MSGPARPSERSLPAWPCLQHGWQTICASALQAVQAYAESHMWGRLCHMAWPMTFNTYPLQQAAYHAAGSQPASAPHVGPRRLVHSEAVGEGGARWDRAVLNVGRAVIPCRRRRPWCEQAQSP